MVAAASWAPQPIVSNRTAVSRDYPKPAIVEYSGVFFKEVELVFTKDRVLARNVKMYPLDSCPGSLRDNTHPDILFSVVSPWSFIDLVYLNCQIQRSDPFLSYNSFFSCH